MVRYRITQLTNNNLINLTDVSAPRISGNNVVWSGNDGNDSEIFFYNGETVIQLTDNDLFDNFTEISGENITWSESVLNPLTTSLTNGSILLYDGNTTTKLADVVGVLGLAISGNNVVWGDLKNSDPSNIGNDNFGNNEVFYYNGSDTIKLGNSIAPAFLPDSISRDNVVWLGSESSNSENIEDAEVFFYDGNTTIQLTDNNLLELGPIISENNIAWTSFNSSDSSEIFFYNGNTTIQLTNNNRSNIATSISGDNLVWQGNDGNDNEIFLYDGNTTTQLTNNATEDTDPRVSRNNVVWQGNDGNDNEIFFYDGNTTTQLTDNEIDDGNPVISGNNIAWVTDDEIFLATPSIVNDEPISEDEVKLYRYRNTSFDSGTYLFVGEAEGNSILADPDLSQTFILEGNRENGNTSSAFTASLEPGDDLIAFYRLRSLDVPGTYLFVGQGEYDNIFADNSDQRNKWEREGLNNEGNDVPEFYLYEGSSNLGVQFNRFQNRQNGTFLYAGPAETEAINSNPNLSASFIDQGVAFASLV